MLGDNRLNITAETFLLLQNEIEEYDDELLISDCRLMVTNKFIISPGTYAIDFLYL